MSLPSAMSQRLGHRHTPPAARVGVIGAGQLARMLHEAAIPLDIEVRVLTEDLGAPAVRAGAIPVIGDPSNLDDLLALAADCDVVTFDHELVSGPAIEALAERVTVRPSPQALRLTQDKLHARTVLAEAGCPVVEQHVAIDVELSVIVARSPSGLTAVYPPLETVQKDVVCREVVAPADVSPPVAEEARRLALSIADGIGLTGVMAVELFVAEGRVLVNELALRPHNSGHVTIEACPTSQFEQHLRAILDWPLGGTRLLSPSAAMVNVLGGLDARGPAAFLPEALAVPEVRVHLYGKEPHEHRHVGHVTALGESRRDTLIRARSAAAVLSR